MRSGFPARTVSSQSWRLKLRAHRSPAAFARTPVARNSPAQSGVSLTCRNAPLSARHAEQAKDLIVALLRGPGSTAGHTVAQPVQNHRDDRTGTDSQQTKIGRDDASQAGEIEMEAASPRERLSRIAAINAVAVIVEIAEKAERSKRAKRPKFRRHQRVRATAR